MGGKLRWKTLNKTTIIKDQWIHLEADECQLPDGTMVSPFYVNRARDFVVIVATTEAGELIVERQYRHGIEEVLLELPAGMIEEGETAEQAACRELMEETGYQASKLDFLFKIAPNASSSSNFAWCYLARNVVSSGKQHLDETELLEMSRMPLNEAHELLSQGGFKQAVHVAALYRALEVLEEC